MFLPPWLGGPDRRRMAHAARHPELLHQSHKPAHRAGGLDAHDRRLGNGGIELPNRLAVMTQRLFDHLASIAIQHRDRLLRRVQITTYNPHLGLLRPERCEVDTAQSTRAVARPTSLWHQYALAQFLCTGDVIVRSADR